MFGITQFRGKTLMRTIEFDICSLNIRWMARAKGRMSVYASATHTLVAAPAPTTCDTRAYGWIASFTVVAQPLGGW